MKTKGGQNERFREPWWFWNRWSLLTPWRELERAVEDALQAYKRAGRLGCVNHSVAQQAHGRWTKKAPVDYHATMQGGRALALEVKQTHEQSLPLRDWQDHQQQELRKQHHLGALAMLLVDFPEAASEGSPFKGRETYLLPWGAELEVFVLDPWRDSLSLAMCRSWGLLVPWQWAAALRRSMPMLLEGVAHPRRAQAQLEVERDRRACAAGPAKEYVQPVQLVGPKSKAELLERVQAAIAIGTRNAAKRGR
jgi:penicillin-binding protein-related factor A (putative recombinase)